MTILFDAKNPSLELRKTTQKIAGLSMARLVVFLVLGAILIVGLSELRWLLLFFFPLSAAFIYLIVLFNRQKDRQAFLKAVIDIEKHNKQRKQRELGGFDAGREFMDKKHPFCNDLDLFGEHSLFQLIDHTVNEGGRKLLAGWMKEPFDTSKAKKRYSAVEELSHKTDFTRNFEAFGKAFTKNEKPKDHFYAWLRTKTKWKSLYLIPMVLGPLGGLLLIMAWLFVGLSAAYVGIWIILGLVFLGMIYSPLMEGFKAMPDEGDLKTFTAWANELEEIEFQDPSLKKMQKPIFDGSYKASDSLTSLEQKSFMVQNRANLIYLIFNLLFWVDFLVLWRLEKWKSRHASHIRMWEDVFQEWQVMVSLASFTANEKLSCKLEWTNELVLEAADLHHPLLNRNMSVGNDFTLEREHKIILLTGSNMSGKTTFMRTVGINLVLINLGLNPFASRFVSGPFQLFTSMRNTDSLGENVSSFYAELARIKGLLQEAEKQQPLFFLLDEILKGTNTTDRVMGSEALIRQLEGSLSKGIISTHDIELSQLEGNIPSLINYSFHSDIQEDEIRFDYKIKAGPCPSFNAHKLMELMGIRFN